MTPEPPAYDGFRGHVGRTFAGSRPWWPPRAAPGPGAPNIVVVLVDDLGFADLGCYGSEIPTPHIDALAADGVRLTDFHVTPMCSPTRAALLTGVNPHLAGVGHISNSDPGFPGYAQELHPGAITLAEEFRAAGWATLAVGKWHLTKDGDMSDAGPRHGWPLQRGFDRFYGFLDAFTDHHNPHRLVRDNHTVEVDAYPDGYYLADDLTDQAVRMVRQVRAADPERPFLLYLAHGAVHAPLQAKPDAIAARRGAYDAGWDAVRAARHRRQRELGLFPADMPLPARNSEEGDDVAPWADLTADERRLFARYMEVYAAMVTSVDDSVGRLRAALADLGELENTIIVVTSDNGASREGEARGTTQYFRTLTSHNIGRDREDFGADLARIDLVGGPRTLAHYPRGWAMAANTPFRLYKINTHSGGHSVPFVASWPAGLPARGELRHQWAYVTDVLPTLLELAGVAPRGHPGALPRSGASLVPVLRDPSARHPHTEQYAELQGHRGYYRDGWEAVTRHRPLTPFGDHEWELYDRRADRGQAHDLAAERPDKVRELAAAWERAAWDNQVFPLDEGSRLRYLLRPDRAAPGRVRPVRLTPDLHTLERYRSQRLIERRSFTVDVELRYRPGDAGTLVAHGGQGGGYALYVEGGEPVLVFNAFGDERRLACGPLEDGARAVRLAVTARAGLAWSAEVLVDGRTAGRIDDLPMLTGMAPFEGIDVGADRRSPVSWEIRRRYGTFPYTGELAAVTYTPGDPAPGAGQDMIELVREIGLRYE
ncbi:MAG TPA: arylsulfatase [Streptosporangiaceae bacterium]